MLVTGRRYALIPASFSGKAESVTVAALAMMKEGGIEFY